MFFDTLSKIIYNHYLVCVNRKENGKKKKSKKHRETKFDVSCSKKQSANPKSVLLF